MDKGGYTPSIVLAEISRKYLREGASLETVKKRLIFIEAKTTIVEITVEIAIKAAEKYLELLQHAKKTGERQPSLADAVVYAAALYLGDDVSHW